MKSKLTALQSSSLYPPSTSTPALVLVLFHNIYSPHHMFQHSNMNVTACHCCQSTMNPYDIDVDLSVVNNAYNGHYCRSEEGWIRLLNNLHDLQPQIYQEKLFICQNMIAATRCPIVTATSSHSHSVGISGDEDDALLIVVLLLVD